MTGVARDWKVPDSFIFDGTQSRKALALNEFCLSLTKAENRTAFRADEAAYIDRYPMTAEQRAALIARDWLRLLQLGANIYFLITLAGATKVGLYELGAQLRGQTLDQFLQSRNVKGAT